VGGKADKSIVKWRRSMVVLASAGGNSVEAIARLVQTSPDRVREVIHRFNEMGMASLNPKWAGGRPRRITTDDEVFIVKTAKARPDAFGLPFIRWSLRKLATPLADNPLRRVMVGRERLRARGKRSPLRHREAEEEVDDTLAAWKQIRPEGDGKTI